MLDMQTNAADAEIAPVTESRDRNAVRRELYADRKGGETCMRCPQPRTEDSPYCAGCLATEVERARTGMRKLLDQRRDEKRCRGCGAPMKARTKKQSRCKACRRKRRDARAAARDLRRGEEFTRPVADLSSSRLLRRSDPTERTTLDAERGGDTYNPGTHARYHGKQRRGGTTRAESDAWDLRTIAAELAAGIAAMDAYHTALDDQLPVIQRDALLQDALAHFSLLDRQLEEFVDRAKRRLR